MTQNEFLSAYAELAEHFGQNNFSAKRGKLLFETVKELSAEWWTSVAHRMIIANDARFDIYAAAKSEISANRGWKRVQEETGALQSFSRNLSEAGLSETLGAFGAKSLWDAIEKRKWKGA